MIKEEEESPRQRREMSQQLKEKIRKKPFYEPIDNVQYTYSLLKKKNKSFFLTNERLLMLKGSQSIGYAR